MSNAERRELLIAVGEKLFGKKHWRRALARALKTDDRLVRRWSSGVREIPEWVPAALERLQRGEPGPCKGRL